MNIHSVDEKTWLTKLDRITQLAEQDNTVVFNNLGHILDVEMLQVIYRELDGSKAIGIDGVTKEKYGKKLGQNLTCLLQRIRRGTYKPQAARIVEIPKEDGSTRPLAISCFEDKLVQTAVNKIPKFVVVFIPYISIVRANFYQPLLLFFLAFCLKRPLYLSEILSSYPSNKLYITCPLLSML
jgi:RNA-directed DNA polymerase